MSKWTQSAAGKAYAKEYRRKNKEKLRRNNRIWMRLHREECGTGYGSYVVMGIFTNSSAWKQAKRVVGL